ncbi:hypothetical protein NMY22_g18991 [Coprinellus aureogranulatus]|nr:hypothetical protein NMY22_g18991 [Coprinellus aureogranulatus]
MRPPRPRARYLRRFPSKPARQEGTLSGRTLDEPQRPAPPGRTPVAILWRLGSPFLDFNFFPGCYQATIIQAPIAIILPNGFPASFNGTPISEWPVKFRRGIRGYECSVDSSEGTERVGYKNGLDSAPRKSSPIQSFRFANPSPLRSFPDVPTLFSTPPDTHTVPACSCQCPFRDREPRVDPPGLKSCPPPYPASDAATIRSAAPSYRTEATLPPPYTSPGNSHSGTATRSGRVVPTSPRQGANGSNNAPRVEANPSTTEAGFAFTMYQNFQPTDNNSFVYNLQVADRELSDGKRIVLQFQRRALQGNEAPTLVAVELNIPRGTHAGSLFEFPGVGHYMPNGKRRIFRSW